MLEVGSQQWKPLFRRRAAAVTDGARTLYPAASCADACGAWSEVKQAAVVRPHRSLRGKEAHSRRIRLLTAFELGWERLGRIGIEEGEIVWGRLQGVGGLWWRADDQPQLIAVGVIE
jgi:hypothetical protein